MLNDSPKHTYIWSYGRLFKGYEFVQKSQVLYRVGWNYETAADIGYNYYYISSCQSTAISETVKRFWSLNLTHVSSTWDFIHLYIYTLYFLHSLTVNLFSVRGRLTFCCALKACPHVAEKCDSRWISPLPRRFRRQLHFSATVWTGLKIARIKSN